jgi:uncharacterized membrane protein
MSKSSAGWVAIAAATAAVATLVPVALYQGGAIEELPDPPGEWFDSERITSGKSAHPLGIPDSYLGLASYGLTLLLLVKARKSKVARVLLGAKLDADGSMAAVNFGRQVVSFHKLCSWCSGTALATAVMVPAGKAYLRELER